MPLPQKDRNSFLQELHVLLTDVKQVAYALIPVLLLVLCMQGRLPVSDLVDLLSKLLPGPWQVCQVLKCPTLPPALPSQFFKDADGLELL